METEEITHTRKVMLIFQLFSAIGGLNRLLWTIGGLIIGFLYKDRLVMEITEDLYILKSKGKEIDNFQSVDILIK
jgi:hypothetical protein